MNRKKREAFHPLGKKLREVLPEFMHSLQHRKRNNFQDVWKSFIAVVTDEEKDFLQFVKWENKNLYVKVTSHTMYTHLVRYKKEAYLTKMRQICSFTDINDIIFRR